MKEIILYAYHLDVEILEEQKDYVVFQIDEITYYFTKVKRTEQEFQELMIVMNELLQKNVPIFPFVLNREGKYLTAVDNNLYVLMMVTDPLKEYGLLDILNFQKTLTLNTNKSSLYRNTWATLWSEKVDYFEYQVHEMGKKYPIILNSFSYYVGLAENAISYAKFTESHIPKPVHLPIVLSHRRVKYPNIRLNYANPLQFIFDLEVRDVAGYIKDMFFKEEENAYIDLETFLKLRKPDLYSLSMLYARLMYPSYYFDIHEKIVEYHAQEEELLPMIDKIDQYEIFLKKAYYLFRQYAPIEPVMWIIKKES